MVSESIKNSFYTYKEISEMSGVPVPTISAWVRGITTPSAQGAVNLLSALGLVEHHNVKERMKSAKGSYTTLQIEEVSGIPLSSLENYLYHGTMPSYQTYLDYMQSIEVLNDKLS
jgi:hypothetical protein